MSRKCLVYAAGISSFFRACFGYDSIGIISKPLLTESCVCRYLRWNCLPSQWSRPTRRGTLVTNSHPTFFCRSPAVFSSVRISTIPAFGTIMETVTQKEVRSPQSVSRTVRKMRRTWRNADGLFACLLAAGACQDAASIFPGGPSVSRSALFAYGDHQDVRTRRTQRRASLPRRV